MRKFSRYLFTFLLSLSVLATTASSFGPAVSAALGTAPNTALLAAPVTRNVGPSRTLKTIQAAINASSAGDLVLVDAGTYHEPIEFNGQAGKYVTVQSVLGPAQTIIDGSGFQTSVVFFHDLPYKSEAFYGPARLTGFTIQNGASPQGQGGGITIFRDSDVIVDHNIIQNNSASLTFGVTNPLSGGGIVVYGECYSTIRDNIIRNNTVNGYGGGIYLSRDPAYPNSLDAKTVIYNNIFTGNNATAGNGVIFPDSGGAAGGAIFTDYYASPLIISNTIQSNTADFTGGGIALRTGSSAIIEDNTIDSNQAGIGGGVHIETGMVPTSGPYNGVPITPIVNKNTISNNKALLRNGIISGNGGGVSVYAYSTPLITNNTISGNTATGDANNSGGGGALLVGEFANATIRGNTINNNTAGTVSGLVGGGAVFVADAGMSFINNVVYNNVASVGGAIELALHANAAIYNNTFVRNNCVANPTTFPFCGGALHVTQQGTPVVIAAFANNLLDSNNNYQIFEEKRSITTVAFSRNFITNSAGLSSSLGAYNTFFASSNDVNFMNARTGSTNYPNSSSPGSNPGFNNPGGNDYNLTASSDARDKAVSTPPAKINLVQATIPADDNAKKDRGFNNTGTYDLSSYDIGAFEYSLQGIVKTPLYRFYSQIRQGHFFTADRNERNNVLSAYPARLFSYEGKAYDVFTSQAPNTTAVFRFFSSKNNTHFYTTSTSERDALIADPSREWAIDRIGPLDANGNPSGINFYVYPLSFNGFPQTAEAFRFVHSPTSVPTRHFWTINVGEKDFTVRTSTFWQLEPNFGWKVPTE